MSFDAEIGLRIRKIRKERRYSREKLAEYADISVNFLGAVETGKKSMTVQYLAKIAKALNVTTDYLIYGSAPDEQNAEINAILSSMSKEKRKQVEKMLVALVEMLKDYENEHTEKEE